MWRERNMFGASSRVRINHADVYVEVRISPRVNMIGIVITTYGEGKESRYQRGSARYYYLPLR